MLVRSLVAAAVIAGALSVPAPAQAAAPGPVLDPSFGSGGWVSNDHGPGDSVLDLSLQPDGKILAIGSGNEGYFVVERHRTDGSLDGSFGTGGFVVTDVEPASFWDQPTAVTALPDGRVLAAGSVSRNGFAFPALIRYLADGSVDTSYGTDGRVFPALSAATYAARLAGLVRQPNGRVVLALEGATTDGSPPPALVRLLPSGALDSSFGTGGVVYADLGPREFDFVSGVALAPDGDIVVAGATGYYSTLPEPTADLLLARFTARGALDKSFGSGGRVVRDITGPQGIDGTAGLAVGRDGAVVQTAWLQEGDNRRYGILRYLANGEPDRTFGRAGYVAASGPVESPIIRANGRITTTGSAGSNVALGQYRADGRPDASFGIRGVAVADIGSSSHGGVLKIQPDGRLLVGGTTGDQGDSSFGIFRFLP